MTPQVSIIIPARNADRTIGALLDDLASMDNASAEIIVVDDGSTDDTAAVVRSHTAALPTLRLLEGPGRGPAAARNTGAQVALAPWLAFVDADVRLPEDWLAQGIAATRDGVDVVEGSVARRGGDSHGLIRHWALSDGDGVFVTANLWVSKAAFDAVDGFDEGYPVPWREDTDLGWRLVESGARTTTRQTLVAFHPYYRRPVKSLLHTGPKIVADARLRSKFPERARRLQPRRELRRAYVCAALVVATLVALVAGAPLVALALGLAAELAAVAAVLPMAAYRGTTDVGEWAQLIVLAPAICVSRVFWVVRSNLEYRVRFW